MPQQAVTIENLPQAFEVVKEMPLPWGIGPGPDPGYSHVRRIQGTDR